MGWVAAASGGKGGSGGGSGLRSRGGKQGTGAGLGWGASTAYVAVVAAVVCAAAALPGADGAVSVTAFSHFRYGSIHWEAGKRPNEAVFTVNAAFRKDYNWGAYFKEQWRDTRKGATWTSALATPKLPCYNPTEVTSKNPSVQCFDQYSFEDFAGNYQVRFLAGLGAVGNDLIPNPDAKDAYAYNATAGHKTRDAAVSAAGENQGGKVCKCRFHKGVGANDPLCKGSVDPLTGLVLKPFDEAKAAQIQVPAFALGTVRKGAAETDMKTCTPWSDAYGFFFGDDSFNADGLVMDITEVIHESGLLGNMVRMRSQKFSHLYPAATAPGGGAWTAFWIGGNKAKSIQNNKLGRFRLEVGVRFDGGAGNGSPIITAPPIIPVLYTAGGATFSIPAHDPDVGDTVAYFLGDEDEQGGLLGNEDLSGNFTYHIDVYRLRACQSGRAPDSICRQTTNSGLDLATAAGYTRLTSPAEQLPDWTDATNLPHQPPQLSINVHTGVVTWRTGKDPWTADADGSQPVAPGFYNLVVMVEERKPGNKGIATRGTGIKVPVDLLLYLHPPMSYCSLDCDNSNSGNMLPTSETADGLYGHPSTGGLYPLGGTGSCKVCGGGGKLKSSSNARVPVYEDEVNYQQYNGAQRNGTNFCNVRQFVTGGPNGDPFTLPNSESCCNNGMTTAATEYGQVSDPAFVRPMPTGYNFTGCLGAAYPSVVPLTVVPYTGVLDPCSPNSVPIFLTNATTPAGATPLMTPQLLQYNSTTVAMPALAKKTFTLGSDVSYTLDAYDADRCNEVSVKSADLRYGMALTNHVRATKNRVSRRLEWAPYRTLANGTRVYTDDPELDERERITVTCFYATDGYEQTSHPPHCVEVTLLYPARINWCASTPASGVVLSAHIGEEVSIELCVRKGEGVAAPVDIRAITVDEPGTVPYNPTLKIYGETNTTTAPVLPVFAAAPAMPNITNCSVTAGGTVVSLVHGPGMNITTCTNATNASALIAAAQAPAPGHDFNATLYLRWTNPTMPFAPPHNSINVPMGGVLDPANSFPYADPFTRRFRFTPKEGQECAFTVCFEGYDASTSPGTVDNPEEVTGDKRCYKIEVHNSVIEFDGTASASAPNLSAAVPPSKGLAVSAWIKPDCAMSGGGNVTVLAFGSTRNGTAVAAAGVSAPADVGLSLRNSIGWTPGKTAALPGTFYYADCRSGYAASAAAFACGVWHSVGFSIGADGAGVMYVDGVKRTHHVAGLADTVAHAAVPFRTDSRPDGDAGAGTFVVGAGGFKGSMDDVRVWGAGLGVEQMAETMFARRIHTAVAAGHTSLLADYTMRPGRMPPTTPAAVKHALSSHPGVTPCVLGVERAIGPTAGGCFTTVYGWNFAPGAAPKCGFNGRQSRAQYVSPTAVRCETPGRVPAGEAVVTASNDGAAFTDAVLVGKKVSHLALESSLWSAGGSGYGANADGACAHLDRGADSEVSFGGWFCPNCAE